MWKLKLNCEQQRLKFWKILSLEDFKNITVENFFKKFLEMNINE